MLTIPSGWFSQKDRRGKFFASVLLAIYELSQKRKLSYSSTPTSQDPSRAAHREEGWLESCDCSVSAQV
jgi:hypothetical protein